MDENREADAIDRQDAHPRAAEILTDDFFWQMHDEGAPLGTEIGRETLELYREWRADHPKESALTLLGDLLRRWEVVDANWDTVDIAEVQAVGEEDEWSLLTRDDVILALAFAELVEEGNIDPEVRRRAVLATFRQELPTLLIVWGDRTLERAKRLVRMREVLSRLLH